jgi:hypothetical protein
VLLKTARASLQLELLEHMHGCSWITSSVTDGHDVYTISGDGPVLVCCTRSLPSSQSVPT